MSPEGCNFAAGDEEKLVEVGLQFAQSVVMRIGVVVGDGDEVEPARGCCFSSEEDGAGNFSAALAQATAVAVRGVHVQVAAIPGWAFAQRRVCERCDGLIWRG